MGSLLVLDCILYILEYMWAAQGLSIGLCTVHDIIVELRARLYDIKGGSMHSTRHRSRLL